MLGGVLFLHRLEHAADRARAGAGELHGQVAQLSLLDVVQIGVDDERDERLDHFFLVGPLDRLAHGGGVVFQLVDGATMGETMYPGRAVGAAQDLGDAGAVVDTLDWVGQRRAGEAHLDRPARRPTVQPASSSSSNGSTTSGSSTPSHWRSIDASGGGHRDAGAFGDVLGLRLDIDAARPAPRRSPAGALPWPAVPQAWTSRRWSAAGRRRRCPGVSPSAATGRRLSRSCASGGTRIGPPSNTSRSGAPTMRSTMDRSSNWPPVPIMHQPNPASQQRSCRALRKRTASVPSCTKRKTCRPLEPGSFSSVSDRNSPALVECRVTRATLVELGQHREQRRPEAAMALDRGRDLVRHALGIVVEQHEGRLFLAVDDIVAGSGDEVAARAVDEALRLGGDVHLIRAGRPAARRGAIAWLGSRPPISAASSSTSATGARRATPLDIMQALPSLLTAPSAVSEMRLVSGPSDFVKIVISVFTSHTTRPRWIRSK